MTDHPGSLDRLSQELDGAPPIAIASLEAADLETLARAVTAAREHQDAALSQAMEDGLGFIPRLLRGTVKKVLFG